jgi:hypothetical protein
VAGFAGKLAILIVKAELNKDRKILLFPSGKCNQSHADNFRVIFIDLFFPLTFSWTGWYRYYRFWDGLFFLQPFHGRVGFEITGFGTGCNFFCLSIRGFWTWTGKNFVKKQAWGGCTCHVSDESPPSTMLLNGYMYLLRF